MYLSLSTFDCSVTKRIRDSGSRQRIRRIRVLTMIRPHHHDASTYLYIFDYSRIFLLMFVSFLFLYSFGSHSFFHLICLWLNLPNHLEQKLVIHSVLDYVLGHGLYSELLFVILSIYDCFILICVLRNLSGVLISNQLAMIIEIYSYPTFISVFCYIIGSSFLETIGISYQDRRNLIQESLE